ncbi:MAG: hypothetical protein P4L79_17890 [Legionella sp.]|uniref:hypothetical protein n=1 Tax=Legionella sp. TaxID=459 RepID=UPI00283F564D|nr:hypothetical protein [Legionella sp.]
MIKIIERATALLKKVTSWYEKRNTEQAVKTLYSKQKYLAGFFNGFNTFLDHFTKYGAVITLALSVASFLGFSMTPVGWITVGAAMLIGGMVLAGHSIYSYLDKSKKLMESVETRDAHERQIKDLAKEIELQYAQHDALEKELETLRQSAENLGISIDLETTSAPPFKAKIKPIESESAQNGEKENQFIQALKNVAIYVATPFIVLAQPFIKLAQLLRPQLKELMDATSPIQKRFKEFAAVLTFVTTAFTGLFTWMSSLLGGGITQLSFLQTLTSLTASLTPVGLGLICATILLTSASLLLNKIFFKDPHEQLTKELEEKREVHIDSLNQNHLLLSQIESKNGYLKEKVKLLTLKIDLVQNALKDKEHNKRRVIDADESKELLEHSTTANDPSSTSETSLKQKLTDNIHSLQRYIQWYQEQLIKLERKETLEKSDEYISSEEDNSLELTSQASLPLPRAAINSEGRAKSPLQRLSMFKNDGVVSDNAESLTPKKISPV